MLTRQLIRLTAALTLLTALAACAPRRAQTFVNRNMDFGAIKTVAVLPFWNLTRDPQASDRVRDVFANALLASGAVYVLPIGEVNRAVARLGIANPATPSDEEVTRVAGLLKVDAVFTGVVKEYGEVRTSTSAANVVSVSVQMHEAATAKVVWSGASTKGGIGWGARLLGTAGGDAVNDVTEQAADDLLRQLFQ